MPPLGPMPPLIPGSNEPPPGILRDVYILPRQRGESLYQYRYRRTVAQYGQTPYQRRIYLAQQRGIGISAARGHPRRGGETESQRRNRLSREQTGFTVSQLRRQELTRWLNDYGYTPETTGLTWTQLIRLAPRLRWMYNAAGPRARVTPRMIYDAVQLERDNALEKGWAFERLWRKYDDMQAYRGFSDKEPGRESWYEYQQVSVYIPDLAPQWWYYH